jgi:thiamine biosynthesis lipoprotein
MNTKLFREVETWGTMIVIELSSSIQNYSVLSTAADEAEAFLIHVDEVFSTFKSESEVSILRRGDIQIENCSVEMKEVWNACCYARDLTLGSFDPWCVSGGFDPSGYVKGWAADKCGQIFEKYGIENSLVNASGDFAVRGMMLTSAGFVPWQIGIRHPKDPDSVVKIFEITNCSIATSGTYERPEHIRDPHSGLIAIGSSSATVLGPDGGLTDALATAVVVSGQDGALWFTHPDLSRYQVFAVERHNETVWEIAGNFVSAGS